MEHQLQRAKKLRDKQVYRRNLSNRVDYHMSGVDAARGDHAIQGPMASEQMGNPPYLNTTTLSAPRLKEHWPLGTDQWTVGTQQRGCSFLYRDVI